MRVKMQPMHVVRAQLERTQRSQQALRVFCAQLESIQKSQVVQHAVYCIHKQI
jgi:hypothetical protein